MDELTLAQNLENAVKDYQKGIKSFESRERSARASLEPLEQKRASLQKEILDLEEKKKERIGSVDSELKVRYDDIQKKENEIRKKEADTEVALVLAKKSIKDAEGKIKEMEIEKGRYLELSKEYESKLTVLNDKKEKASALAAALNG